LPLTLLPAETKDFASLPFANAKYHLPELTVNRK
jgi:hypothetical protein